MGRLINVAESGTLDASMRIPVESLACLRLTCRLQDGKFKETNFQFCQPFQHDHWILHPERNWEQVSTVDLVRYFLAANPTLQYTGYSICARGILANSPHKRNSMALPRCSMIYHIGLAKPIRDVHERDCSSEPGATNLQAWLSESVQHVNYRN